MCTLPHRNRFNPRAPCGARQRGWLDFKAGTKFQSTRPMRGATVIENLQEAVDDVSIHAPHAGRDGYATLVYTVAQPFQSTRPMRGATGVLCERVGAFCVSIHAPHAGRDSTWRVLPLFLSRFNPRAPCGARPGSLHPRRSSPVFQSTRPMRGATAAHRITSFHGNVSIHAPHAGRDCAPCPVAVD